ncbi:MAG TPA: GlsB/YeaQ/YmgE family stress response membrane protein [Candidatus Dormibacteraeota bacterium]|nr:GlsB/YeaQ/YmgE family stress response membrane protein [Candidatus Dormibacteraeota bacterium]
MTLDHLLLILLVGLVAGFLASHLVAGHGYGLRGDLVVGIAGSLIGVLLLGGLIGTYILAPLGIPAESVLGMILVSFIGAAVLLVVLRLVTRSGFARRRRRWL